MKFHTLLLPALAVVAFAPSAVIAQQRGTPAQAAANRQAASDMRSRLSAANDRIISAAGHGKLSGARAATLRREVATAQRDMARLSRRQGFVSAAELATYGRLVDRIDTELSAGASPRPTGQDGLASAEVIAFQRTDARLHWRDARIEYDGRSCAVYQGKAPDGRVRREPLRDRDGRALCTR